MACVLAVLSNAIGHQADEISNCIIVHVLTVLTNAMVGVKPNQPLLLPCPSRMHVAGIDSVTKPVKILSEREVEGGVLFDRDRIRSRDITNHSRRRRCR